MEEKQISEIESLGLIQQMIQTAKQEQRDDGKGWIIWGWMLFLASVLTVINMHARWIDDIFAFWNVFGVISLIYFAYGAVKFLFFSKRKRVRTYTGDLFSKLNTGFFISLMFVIISINVSSRVIYEQCPTLALTPVRIGFALLINLYAFWVLIYGTVLNFRPSIIGAYITWAIGFAALFTRSFEVAMLLHAAAALCGYIVPGHLANRAFRKTTTAGV